MAFEILSHKDLRISEKIKIDLIKLNNIIEKKFQKNIKEINEKTKEKISKINRKNDAKKIK